jgi:hypothetical protein
MTAIAKGLGNQEIEAQQEQVLRLLGLAGGERGWIRTSDPRLKRALLYQLSYAPNTLSI